MKVFVGPVARESVLAWAEWAHGVIDDLRNDPRAGACLSARVLEDYVAEWEGTTGRSDGTFRWNSEVHAEDLEYLTNALYNLDLRLAADDRSRTGALPVEGRLFHLVLVRALLSTLALEGSTHAAFADQMQAAWPTAAEVR
jgi:hypothetical protein